MKVYLVGEEIDEMLLKYVYTFCLDSHLVVCGHLSNVKYLRTLSLFNVEFTDSNIFCDGIGDVPDYSDGVILTAQDTDVVINTLIGRGLNNYKFRIRNIITGEEVNNLIILKSFDTVSKGEINIVSNRSVDSVLNLNNSMFSKMCNSDIPLVNFKKTEGGSKVYFNITDPTIVPVSKGFIESDIKEYMFKFDLVDTLFSCFDRRFLRSTIQPITNILICSNDIPTLNMSISFPYNILLDTFELTIPTKDRHVESVIKDFIYSCFRFKVCPIIYLSHPNDDLLSELDRIGYPIELVKIWRFDYNE